MKLKIKYFGRLSEVTNCLEEQIEFPEMKVEGVLDLLFQKYPDLKNNEFQVALNNQIVNRNLVVSEGELALLPPFSGG